MTVVKGRRWPAGVPFVGFKLGDFTFGSVYAESEEPSPKWLRFGCPRGRGECSVPLHPQSTGKGHTWRWDGNRDSPTLAPSINCLAHEPGNPTKKYAGCGWHGHLRNGAFEEC